MAVLILFSPLSGLVTVLSPCILPVLPIVLSSTLTGGVRRPIGVVAGLIISFSIFTLVVSRIVSGLGLSANTLRISAVVIIGLLGVKFSRSIPVSTVFTRCLMSPPGITNTRTRVLSSSVFTPRNLPSSTTYPMLHRQPGVSTLPTQSPRIITMPIGKHTATSTGQWNI